MAELNANHRDRVAGIFAQVDDRLRAVEHLVQGAFSPFEATLADLAPEETALLLTAAEHLRRRLLDAMDTLGVARPQPKTAARWSAYTALQFGEVDLLELTPDRLRGYGRLAPDAAAVIARLTDELRGLLERTRHQLVPEGSRRDYRQLPGLSAASAALLRPIAELVADHRLLEVRPHLAAAVDHAGRDTVDIGVFGRASAGKSALLNALLGEALLPVDVVPMTAVPIRIRGGQADTIRVRFVDGEARTLPRAALTDYATESANPGNRQGVWVIEACAAGAPPGLCLVDTPGVGSLALATANQAMAWALRCEIGLILVPAGNAMTDDDIHLTEAFYHAGATCELLLSKSDLLAAGARERNRDYLTQALHRALGPDHGIRVTPVSTRGGDAGLRGLRGLRRRLNAVAASDGAPQAFTRRYRQLLTATRTALDDRGALTANTAAILTDLEQRAGDEHS